MIEPDVEPGTPRRYGLSAIEAIGIAATCVTLICALIAILPGT